MLQLFRNLAKQKRLLKELVVRDLKARYVGSSMGFFWSVIYPLLNLVVYSFVFREILAVRFDDKMPAEENVLMIFAGILVWTAFAESVARCTNSLVENANLIQKVVFPSEVLAPYLTLSSLVNMTIGLPLVLAAVAWYGYVAPARAEGEAAAPAALVREEVATLPGDDAPGAMSALPPAAAAAAARPPGGDPQVAPKNPTTQFSGHVEQEVAPRFLAFGPGLVALPLLALVQVLFSIGLGYLLSAFNLLVRDTAHVIGVLLMVWMFSTPIFYPAQLVEIKGYGWVLDYNPMNWLVQMYRDVLLYGEWPTPALFLRFAAVAVATLFVGASFFQRQKPAFPDLL